MTDSNNASVLRRKLAPRASLHRDAGAADGPARALVRSFARAVTECAPLMAEKGLRATCMVSLAELIDSVDPDAFVGLLTGGDGPPGLAIIDQSGFSALVEAMTIGRLSAREPTARRATVTDAALLGEVLNAALARLDDDDPARGLAMHRPVPDNRLLAVLLDDLPYTLVTLDVALVSGDVRRPARIGLALPQFVPATQPHGSATSAGTDASGTGTAAAQDWTRALESSVMTAPAALQAELGRITLPLAEVLALGQDNVLTLPLSNMEEVRLVDLDGALHATGRLGQSRGMRAVRLTTWTGTGPPDPAMFEQARPQVDAAATTGLSAPPVAKPADGIAPPQVCTAP